MSTTATLETITGKLHSQVAIKATEFGALLGMDSAQTSRAITDGRLGLDTFQIIDRGQHMVASQAVLDLLAARGITL